jgi:hypothetical protein
MVRRNLPRIYRLLRIKKMRIFTLLLLCVTALARSQNPVFKAALEADEVATGTPFTVTFTLEGAEGKRFTPPSFGQLRPAGGVSESRGFSIINGKTSVKQSWAYTLEAPGPGEYTVGSALVTVNGRQISTNPVRIKVTERKSFRNSGTPSATGGDVFIAGELNTRSAFPGQQVIWRLTLYTRVAIEGADLISLPSFNGLFSRERKRFDPGVNYQTIKGVKYAVKVLHEESLFPQSPGEVVIGEAQVRVGLQNQSSFFGVKPVTLTSGPATLQVNTLPEPAPEGFSGGVGAFSWEVSADTNAITTDGALTLSVTLKGNGDARRFGKPKLDAGPAFEVFEPSVQEEESYESLDEVIFTRKMEYVLLPKSAGDHEFTPQLVYFHPDSNRYSTLTSGPVRVTVSQGQNIRKVDMPEPASEEPDVHSDSPLNATLLFAVLFAALLTVTLILFYRKRKKVGPIVQTPTTHVSSGSSAPSVSEIAAAATYGELLRALQSFLCARLNLPVARLNREDVSRQLTSTGMSAERVRDLITAWDDCEMAVYAGAAPDKFARDRETIMSVLSDI